MTLLPYHAAAASVVPKGWAHHIPIIISSELQGFYMVNPATVSQQYPKTQYVCPSGAGHRMVLKTLTADHPFPFQSPQVPSPLQMLEVDTTAMAYPERMLSVIRTCLPVSLHHI